MEMTVYLTRHIVEEVILPMEEILPMQQQALRPKARGIQVCRIFDGFSFAVLRASFLVSDVMLFQRNHNLAH